MRAWLTLHHPRAAASYYDKGFWTGDTFYTLMDRHAWEKPETDALRDGKAMLSWDTLRTRVDALAAEFEGLGLTAGDRVSLWLSNKAEAVVAFLACSRLGIACNPSLHKTYTCEEVVTLLTRLEASVLVTEEGWGADRATVDLDSALKKLPFIKKVLQPDEFPAAGPAPQAPVHDDPDTIAYLAFTSGTTGAPKCVMHSCNTLLSNARDLVRDWQIGSETRLLTMSPLSHHIAWVAFGQWLVSGCLLILDDPPRGASQLDWILETGANYVMGVPTHAIDVLAEQKTRGLARLSNVEIFYMAGSPIPAVVAEAFVAQGIKPQNVYGMTENSSHQYTHPADSPDVWINTCGRGGAGYQVKIFKADDPDAEAAPGETGQIAGRGADLMLGYYDSQTATANSFNRSGWFLSGDLGSMDEAGNLRIEGRLKDLIIRGGHNIYPSRIEALALRHDEIYQAAAFPVPDERLGEKVCLAINGNLEADAALEHLAAEGLSKFDMPEWFVRLDTFPLTTSGKILKRKLVEMHRRGEIEPVPVHFKPKKETA